MRKLVLLFTLIPIGVWAQEEFQKKIQRIFIDAENGTTISLPEGNYNLNASLWLDGKKNIIIKGAGQHKTILNFANQVTGAEGIKVTNASNITIEDLTLQNTKGDAIKAQTVEGILFKRLTVEWTKGPDKSNGSYGIYPVQCTSVLIDSCVAMGASDAGIYVGQSQHIMVRNCKAFNNVTGIEIENSLYADVYNNETYQNTGGILVFDLPDLVQKKGGYIRVFDNNIHENNLTNFAPKGNIVAKVPPGTGIMILATKHVEVFDNQILNNITAATAIVSYYIAELPIHDKTYDPYPGNIFIHNNHFERPNVRTTGKGRLGKMFRFKLRFGKHVPHILYDGIEDPNNSDRNICIDDNNKNVSFVNMDAGNGFKNKSFDRSDYNCKLPPLDPVDLKLK